MFGCLAAQLICCEIVILLLQWLRAMRRMSNICDKTNGQSYKTFFGGDDNEAQTESEYWGLWLFVGHLPKKKEQEI